MKENRGSWYLLTGLVLGLVAGLVYGWVVQPPVSQDTSPSSLKANYKDVHRLLIAKAYDANEDIVRARARLELLGDEDVQQVLEQQAQQVRTIEGSEEDARVLARLAADLKKE